MTPAALVRPAVLWRSMAVFYRTNALSRVLENAPPRESYTTPAALLLRPRGDQHALAYLRIVANPSDDVRWRIVMSPRAAGSTSNAAIQVCPPTGIPLLEGLRTAGTIPGPPALPRLRRRASSRCTTRGLSGHLCSQVLLTLADLVRRRRRVGPGVPLHPARIQDSERSGCGTT